MCLLGKQCWLGQLCLPCQLSLPDDLLPGQLSPAGSAGRLPAWPLSLPHDFANDLTNDFANDSANDFANDLTLDLTSHLAERACCMFTELHVNMRRRFISTGSH